MQKDLKPAHIQDVAEILHSRHTNRELELIVDRFEADHLSTSGGKKDQIIRWLETENGTPLGRKLLAYLIENADAVHQIIDPLREALEGSRYVLDYGKGEVEVLLKISATADKQFKSQRGFVEKYAPQPVLDRIDKAENELSNGDYEQALAEGRQAFEEMIVGDNLLVALEELVDNQLMGTHHKYTHDKELVYSIWGYCSTLGSHSIAQGNVDKLQGETGFTIFMEAIYFLVSIIEFAKKQNITLNEWKT